MKKNRYYCRLIRIILLACLGLLLAACGGVAAQPLQQQQTVTVNQSFQTLRSPVPTAPTYRCGAWASNNAPGLYDTIIIYARLTKNVKGVHGATAQAVAHFSGFDMPLDQQVTSDDGGYVNFTLRLNGQEAKGTPATVDVTFTVPGNQNSVRCSQAFFTPQ